MDRESLVAEGWKTTTLGEVRKDYSGSVDPSQRPDQLFEHYSVPSFDSGRPTIEEGSEIGSTKKKLEEGMVLLCKINPRINRVWKVESHTEHPKIGSTEWIRFPRMEGLDPDYLRLYMSQDKFRNYLALESSGAGSSLMRVKKSVVDQYPFVLPPLAEQRRIVSQVEMLFTNLDVGSENLKTAEQQLEHYRLSVLQAAVEGRLTAEWRRTHSPEPADQLLETIMGERRDQWEERYRWERYESEGKELPSGWKERYPEPERPEFDEDLEELPQGWLWTSLGYICEMTSGGTPKRSNDDYFGGEIAWLKSGELNDDIITDAEESITEKGFQESSTVLFPEGTLLVALYGATTGRLGILDIEAATNQAICGLYVPPSLNTRYLFWYLRSARSDLLGRRFGGAQKNLSQTILKTVPVPLPPFREQEQIVDEIERMLSIADDLRSSLSGNVRRSKRLRQSILKAAFTGRLT